MMEDKCYQWKCFLGSAGATHHPHTFCCRNIAASFVYKYEQTDTDTEPSTTIIDNPNSERLPLARGHQERPLNLLCGLARGKELW